MANPNTKVFTSLNAATTAAPGTAADSYESTLGVTFQLATSGLITGGAVTFLGSVDGQTFVPLTTAVLIGQSGSPTLTGGVLTMTATTTALVSIGPNNSAMRFYRADVTTGMIGGSVTVKAAWF